MTLLSPASPRGAALLSLAALALAACGGGDDPELAARRTTARRASCVAVELAVRANTNLSALDTLRAGPAPGLVETLYPYQKAYFDYAKLRERQTAWSDSAAATTSEADSARYAGEIARSTPPAPAPGSTQANAAATYERDFTAAMTNPDHPCNRPRDEER
ncbi:MAG TPA: hypothetical protein VF613_05015 [Longimicrobium sp.]|jgi:hypothetical protein